MNLSTPQIAIDPSPESPLLTPTSGGKPGPVAAVVEHPKKQKLAQMRNAKVQLKLQRAELLSKLNAIKEMLSNSHQLTNQHSDHYHSQQLKLEAQLEIKNNEHRKLENILENIERQVDATIEQQLLQNKRRQLQKQIVKLRLEQSKQVILKATAELPQYKTKTNTAQSLARKIKGLCSFQTT